MKRGKNDSFCFIGFGEAAQAFMSGWGNARPTRITAFDIKTNDVSGRDTIQSHYRRHDVRGYDTNSEALNGADVAFCLVTADQALIAAMTASGGDMQGTLWLDGNSCAPNTKRMAADVISRVSGKYVDMAIMAPVHPKKHKVPILLSGPYARDAEQVLLSLGMLPTVVGSEVGQASTIKMLRSVMVKGMEALYAECFLAARKAGIDGEVLASLSSSNPDIKWSNQGAYNLERMMVHGVRRAAEMEEVAKTVNDLGVPNSISNATQRWQRRIGDLELEAGRDDFACRIDRILAAL